MPTCKNCGHKKSGAYFKNKICPNCDELQEIDTKQFDFDIEEQPNMFETEELDETIIVQEPVLLDDSYRMVTEDLISEESDLEGITDEPITDGEIPIGKEKPKFTFSKKTWLIMVARMYKLLDKMLFNLNPEFYGSEEAQELREINAELVSLVLEAKEINPMFLLILGNLLYISPAIIGLFRTKEEDELTEKQESEESETD